MLKGVQVALPSALLLCDADSADHGAAATSGRVQTLKTERLGKRTHARRPGNRYQQFLAGRAAIRVSRQQERHAPAPKTINSTSSALMFLDGRRCAVGSLTALTTSVPSGSTHNPPSSTAIARATLRCASSGAFANMSEALRTSESTSRLRSFVAPAIASCSSAAKIRVCTSSRLAAHASRRS